MLTEATNKVKYGRGNAGVVVLELGESVSVVCLASMSAPPMMMMPTGESQDTWSYRDTPSWWLVSHWPTVKVEQVFQVSPFTVPPHRVSPVAEWKRRPGEGRSGMVHWCRCCRPSRLPR